VRRLAEVAGTVAGRLLLTYPATVVAVLTVADRQQAPRAVAGVWSGSDPLALVYPAAVAVGRPRAGLQGPARALPGRAGSVPDLG
jgi:hypothetical protein